MVVVQFFEEQMKMLSVVLLLLCSDAFACGDMPAPDDIVQQIKTVAI
jgi:hypothetical protein